jgi:hypothetical protein
MAIKKREWREYTFELKFQRLFFSIDICNEYYKLLIKFYARNNA